MRSTIVLTALAGLLACETASGAPVFDGKDAQRKRIDVRMVEVADDLTRPVDVQVPPGGGPIVVVEQPGRIAVLEAGRGPVRLEMQFPDLETWGSEQGLLGLAFHPRFATNGRFFLNTTERGDKGSVTRVTEWKVEPGGRWWTRKPARQAVILEVGQPYGNHNGGGLLFGPDGGLFVGLGDGGSAGDPQGNGQNPAARLGKMLRVDVDTTPPGVTVYATGLRNPWRYTFDPAGRLVVADVGQDRYEEIDLVPKGANMGWNVWEGAHCFSPRTGCSGSGFTGPIWEYDHEDGISVTGGLVARGAGIPSLEGRYVFADYGTGRIWALELPAEAGRAVSEVSALGRFGFSISCFGRGPGGELLLCDHSGGRVMRLAAP